MRIYAVLFQTPYDATDVEVRAQIQDAIRLARFVILPLLLGKIYGTETASAL